MTINYCIMSFSEIYVVKADTVPVDILVWWKDGFWLILRVKIYTWYFKISNIISEELPLFLAFILVIIININYHSLIDSEATIIIDNNKPLV